MQWYTAAGGDVHVPRGGICVWRKAEHQEIDARIGKASVVLRELHRSVGTQRGVFNPFSPACATFLAELCKSYNLPGDWARELFKPSTDSASLVVNIEIQNFSFWVWAFLGKTSQVGVFLRYFGHLFLALGAVPIGHFLDSKFSWKLGQNPRL